MKAISSLGGLLFDLDGTLLDTAPDMARALNRLRCERGLDPLSFACIRPVVSHGSPGLIRLGFDLQPGEPGFETLRQRFLILYGQDPVSQTRLFPGLDRALDRLDSCGVPWGIVTNKPGWLTTPILNHLDLQRRCACTISGDTLPVRKPDPAPLLMACELIGRSPGCCVYLGDAERDVEAGRRSGMGTGIAAYGYIDSNESPHTWGADFLIEHPGGVESWLRSRLS